MTFELGVVTICLWTYGTKGTPFYGWCQTEHSSMIHLFGYELFLYKKTVGTRM